MSTASARLTTPTGPGSVFGAPNLPAGFSDTFTSRYVDTGALRMHAVIGGEEPPLLLIHGWPQTGYAWPRVMATLARDVQVIAVDQRGIGLTDKPHGGYDTGTQARDLVALLQALGHRRIAVYGTDTAMPIAYALAADHPERLERLVVSEAPLPGERAAQGPAAGPACAGHRRRGTCGCHGRGRDAAGRRRRPLGGRAGTRAAAGRPDQIPRSLPGWSSHMNTRSTGTDRRARPPA
jgi:pimeloyl-ACP methyl ester carboxylesterase